MAKNKNKIVIAILIISLLILITCPIYAIGSPIEDPGAYAPSRFEDAGTLLQLGNVIMTLVNVVGSAVAIIAMIIMGIKYVTCSLQEKAEYKKAMMPYLIGAVLLFAGSNIVNMLYQMIPKR